jgi:netrin-G3 ligand
MKSTTESISKSETNIADAVTIEAARASSGVFDSAHVIAIVGAAGSIIIVLLIILIVLTVRLMQRRYISSVKGFDVDECENDEVNVGVVKSSVYQAIENEAYQKMPIGAAEFEKYVKEMHENDNHGFSLEYAFLGRQSDPSCQMTVTSCGNSAKNRYHIIVPYDHARVVLKELPGICDSDYINASYVDAYCHPKGYIACQGPNNETVCDFWRMIWQERVHTIAMVTKLKESSGKTKCSRYWPEEGQMACHGNIIVMFEEKLDLSEFTVRTFHLKNSLDEELGSQIVTQFHFTGWPDHGVPTSPTSFLNYVNRVRNHYDSLRTQSPMVVHCSAGVGRTGTFIAADYSLKKLKKSNQIDIFKLVKEMRGQRPFMVQTLPQYVFCHDAVLEFVLCGDNRVEAPNLKKHIAALKEIDEQTGKSGFQKQLDLLTKLSPSKECFTYDGGKNNTSKNRYNTCIPPDESRIVLTGVRVQSFDDTYICATFVDGYTRSNSYITTQGPLTETTDDFWRLIWENGIECIAMITRLEDNGEEMSVQYWPSIGVEHYGLVSVALLDEKLINGYIMRKFSMCYKEYSRTVIQFHYQSWPVDHVPDRPEQLLDMMNQIQRAQQQADIKTVLIVCKLAIDWSRN